VTGEVKSVTLSLPVKVEGKIGPERRGGGGVLFSFPKLRDLVAVKVGTAAAAVFAGKDSRSEGRIESDRCAVLSFAIWSSAHASIASAMVHRRFVHRGAGEKYELSSIFFYHCRMRCVKEEWGGGGRDERGMETGQWGLVAGAVRRISGTRVGVYYFFYYFSK
jgi:hypothetical protein